MPSLMLRESTSKLRPGSLDKVEDASGGLQKIASTMRSLWHVCHTCSFLMFGLPFGSFNQRSYISSNAHRGFYLAWEILPSDTELIVMAASSAFERHLELFLPYPAASD